MSSQLIREISEMIYSMFVVNSAAAGIQQKNGAYLTRYIPVSPMLIENMILSQGSMGCYQQGMNTGYIKWICFDFDCKNKEHPDINGLNDGAIRSITDVLDELGINYLKEFSGRRGIHVWILFDCIIRKSAGYFIEQEILRRAHIEKASNGEWNLDLFPATDSSWGNKVGKQVKFPLSTHKKGGMSFFFHGDFEGNYITGTDYFFRTQLELLRNYTRNNVFEVFQKLDYSEYYKQKYKQKYKKYRLLGNVYVTSSQIISILSETRVFNAIFERMRNGQPLHQDRTVLMGTLSRCDETTGLLKEILNEFPNYDEAITENNINRLKDRYFPATFAYLYHIYDLEMEEGIKPDSTGLAYLLERLNIRGQLAEEYSSISEKNTLLKIDDTIHKEHDYILYNDEAIDIYIWNQLNLLRSYDINRLQDIADTAKLTGHYSEPIEGLVVYERIESEEKTRRLVSLSAEDRVLTTFLAIKLYSMYDRKWNSYSYRPMITSNRDIFFSWYSAWGNYIKQIRTFIEVPFFSNYDVMYIDLKSFYDHIDFLTVYKTISNTDSEEFDHIIHYLLEYNDALMSYINDGSRIGVPQGPAYARIIAEMFLSQVMEIATSGMEHYLHVYRYVDDIVIICEPGHDSLGDYKKICAKLAEYGLPINEAKSAYYGMIGDLSQEQINVLLHTESYNYDLKPGDKDHILLASEKEENMNRYLTDKDFEIKSLGYVFSEYTLAEVKDRYFKLYRKEIIASRIGRGINFRRFYEYILTHDEYIYVVLEEGLLSSIPIQSLNFDNFVSTLYLLTQERKLSPEVFNRIQREYLLKIDNNAINKNNRSIVDALRMIAWEESIDE